MLAAVIDALEPSVRQSPTTCMPPRRLFLGALAALLLGTAACAPCGQGFALSLANGSGGETSPITAAEWFAVHGGVWSDVPTAGWHVVGSPGPTTDVRSGSMTLQVLQGPDGTWQVESGSEPAC
jgi:hypothetical protein